MSSGNTGSQSGGIKPIAGSADPKTGHLSFGGKPKPPEQQQGAVKLNNNKTDSGIKLTPEQKTARNIGSAPGASLYAGSQGRYKKLYKENKDTVIRPKEFLDAKFAGNPLAVHSQNVQNWMGTFGSFLTEFNAVAEAIHDDDIKQLLSGNKSKKELVDDLQAMSRANPAFGNRFNHLVTQQFGDGLPLGIRAFVDSYQYGTTVGVGGHDVEDYASRAAALLELTMLFRGVSIKTNKPNWDGFTLSKTTNGKTEDLVVASKAADGTCQFKICDYISPENREAATFLLGDAVAKYRQSNLSNKATLNMTADADPLDMLDFMQHLLCTHHMHLVIPDDVRKIMENGIAAITDPQDRAQAWARWETLRDHAQDFHPDKPGIPKVQGVRTANNIADDIYDEVSTKLKNIETEHKKQLAAAPEKNVPKSPASPGMA